MSCFVLCLTNCLNNEMTVCYNNYNFLSITTVLNINKGKWPTCSGSDDVKCDMNGTCCVKQNNLTYCGLNNSHAQ